LQAAPERLRVRGTDDPQDNAPSPVEQERCRSRPYRELRLRVDDHRHSQPLDRADLRRNRRSRRRAARQARGDLRDSVIVAADLSVVQTPMFHSSPSRYAPFLPGYGPTRLMLEGAFAPSFRAGLSLLIALVWAICLNMFAYVVLRRALGSEAPLR
jgi:hypothetical protein